MRTAGGSVGPAARRGRRYTPRMRRVPSSREITEVARDLPLRHRTPIAWARLAAAHLDEFLADHAICEQQAALTSLHLAAHYPEDEELVESMTDLAAEEIHHLRRVCGLLRARGVSPGKRRPNAWVHGLRKGIEKEREPWLKVDRLLVGALIEARSCERFTRLLEVVDAEDVRSLLYDLGPAEKRHWQLFYRLAEREVPPEGLAPRWERWLELERELSEAGGVRPTVHG